MKSILVVDDFRANVVMIQKALTGIYKVMTATSGQDALHILSKKKVDMVIMDIHMPQMDGLETLQRLRMNDKTKDIAVMFLTSRADPKCVAKGFKLGVIDVIAKPIILADIEERIERAFDKIEEQNREKSKLADEDITTLFPGFEGSMKDFFLLDGLERV